MGGSYWDDDKFNKRTADRAKKKEDAFKFDSDIRSGAAAAGTHPKMNPKGVTRESRDSAAHPESLAIMVMMDVTGSMRSTPRIFQQNLKKLMNLLINKEYVAHPQILFGAIGDAYSDSASSQVGQFESGIEMDEDLGRLYLEGRGGGSGEESYDLALYFAARHTLIDCLEKRGKKGYLFIIGDERHYPKVSADQAKQIFGDREVKSDIPIEYIAKDAMAKYEVFFVMPKQTHNWGRQTTLDMWAKLLGQDRVLTLEEPSAISELIALTIGVTEGKTTLADGLKDLAEVTSEASEAIAKSLAKVRANKTTEKPVAGSKPKKGKKYRI